MTDTVAQVPQASAKGRKRAFVVWIVLAVAGAGGGFLATRAGLIPGLGGGHAGVASPGAAEGSGAASGHVAPGHAAGDTVFVPVEPLVVSLTGGGSREYLRFRAELEVEAGQAGEVARIMPRIVDVLNGYLRALEPADLQAPAALTRLRAQMLRRVAVVAGPGRVRDLLVMEFVLN